MRTLWMLVRPRRHGRIGVCKLLPLHNPGPRSQDTGSELQHWLNVSSSLTDRWPARFFHPSANPNLSQREPWRFEDLRTRFGGEKVEWNSYSPEEFARYYRYRPIPVVLRATVLIVEVLLLGLNQVVEKNIRKRAENLGQALSTRPDILPTDYCHELAKLQDHVPPFPTSTALEFVEAELGAPVSELYANISFEPVAAASLGQVYKARLHSGELVAVKVQRPGITRRLALDAYLLQLLGRPLQRFAGARSDLLAMLNEMVQHVFQEVDYVQEGRYAERFAKLYGLAHDKRESSSVRGAERMTLQDGGTSLEGVVKVPKIYWKLSGKGVLTMEWIEGLKLTDTASLIKANLNVTQIVDQGVFCSLRQLLEEGFFHADPHPGNLVVTKEGVLAYFDFGMMSEIRREYRIGLIRTIIHFVNRDSVGLAKDFQVLGLIPKDLDVLPIAQALKITFGEEGTKSQLDFQGIMTQLSDVMYKFNFRLPPEYAMVIRALGSLEGTATILDPEFKVVASAYPFIVGRLLADPDPEMRDILRELLIKNNGSIRWHRLERLVFAIAEQSTSGGEEQSETHQWSARDGLGRRAAAGIKGSFNTRAVASATMDILEYILSSKGLRVRTLLVQDVTQTADYLIHRHIIKYLGLQDVHAGIRDEPATRSTSFAGVEAQVEVDEPGTPSAQASLFWRLYPWVSKQGRPSTLFHWSRYTLANVWGKRSGNNFVGSEIWNEKANKDRESRTQGDTSMEHNGTPVREVVEDGEPKRSGDGTKENTTSREQENKEDISDAFGGRLKVGLQALANAVGSAPEIWVPLIVRLTAKAEARSLGVDIICAILEVHKSRTSEASFLFMSKVLHDMEEKQEVSPGANC